MRVKQVQVLQSAAFARAYKKSNKNRKADVDDAIALIVKNPLIGAPKRGDLVGGFLLTSLIHRPAICCC
ncbi:MAG: hypothetical protein RI904_1186 [Pseudomonadota bacterium]